MKKLPTLLLISLFSGNLFANQYEDLETIEVREYIHKVEIECWPFLFCIRSSYKLKIIKDMMRFGLGSHEDIESFGIKKRGYWKKTFYTIPVQIHHEKCFDDYVEYPLSEKISNRLVDHSYHSRAISHGGVKIFRMGATTDWSTGVSRVLGGHYVIRIHHEFLNDPEWPCQ